MESPREHTARDLAIIAGVMAVLVVPSMFVRDLWNPDEPRYMEVAREMVVMGQYLLPHLNGVVYPDKPPLFFWAAALLWKLGCGVNSARVVSAFCSLVTVWAVYLFTRRHLPGTPPLLASLAALSTLLFTSVVTHGVIDPMLTTLATGILMCGYAALHDKSGRALGWWLGAYGLAGLGVLTKGPVGFLVPALVLLAYAFLDRERVKKGGWSHAWGALLFAAIVLAWLVPAMLVGGHEYTDTILIKQNLGRAVSSYSHRNPPYYFLLRLPTHYFPWALLLPFAGWAAYRMRKSGEAGGALFATTWAVVYVVFFSLISGKRAGYILPIAPALGILSAWYLAGDGSTGPRVAVVRLWLHRVAFGALALLSVVLIASAALVRPILVRVEKDPSLLKEALKGLTPAWHVCVITLLLLPAVVAFVGLVRAVKGRRVGDYLLASAILILMAVGQPCVASVGNVFKSGRLFCREATPYLRQARVVNLFPQDYSGVYNLYTGIVHMPVIEDEQALKEALAASGTVVIGQRSSLLKAFTPDELAAMLLMERNVGHRQMVLLGTPDEVNRGSPSAPKPADEEGR